MIIREIPEHCSLNSLDLLLARHGDQHGKHAKSSRQGASPGVVQKILGIFFFYFAYKAIPEIDRELLIASISDHCKQTNIKAESKLSQKYGVHRIIQSALDKEFLPRIRNAATEFNRIQERIQKHNYVLSDCT